MTRLVLLSLSVQSQVLLLCVKLQAHLAHLVRKVPCERLVRVLQCDEGLQRCARLLASPGDDPTVQT